MKRSTRRTPSLSAFTGNTFFLWTDIMLKSGEMMAASAQVIAHRTGRLASAATPPSKRDRREFALMGQEKMDATLESAQAVGRRLLATDPLLAVRAGRHLFSVGAAMLSLASSRNAAQMLARHARLMRVAAASSSTIAKVSTASAGLASGALKPVHRRATANAKRLAKI